MNNHKANIKYKPIKSNLVNLPSHLSNLLFTANINIQDVIIEITSKSNPKYVGWSGMSSVSPTTLEIDSVFAQAIQLSDTEPITINLKLNNFETSNINLEPVTSSDWELIELHAQNIEDKLLSQTRCVSIGQVLVVYPSSTTVAKLNVVDIGDPRHKFGKISPYCEIAIAPKVRESKSTKSVKSSKSNGKVIEESYDDSSSVLKRGVCLPHKLFSVNNKGYQVYANFQELPQELTSEPYVAVSVVPGPSTATSSSKQAFEFDIKENKRIVARLIDYQSSLKENIGLSSKLALALNISGQIGNIIVLKPAVRNLPKRPTVFTIHPYTTSTPVKQKDTKSSQLMEVMYPELSSSAVTNFTRIPPIPEVLPLGGLLRFKKNEDMNAWIKPYSLDSKKPIRLELGEELLRPGSFVEEKKKELVAHAVGMNGLIEDVVDSFSMGPSGTLIHGNPGSGKTLLLNQVGDKLVNEYGYFIKYVNCNELINETFQATSKILFKHIQACFWNKPSLLILDNLDKIIPVEMEQIDSSKSNQITEFLVTTLTTKITQVSVLVSCQSQESINKLLGSSHLIENYIHLSPPNKQLRFDLLQHYLTTTTPISIPTNLDLMDVVSETEGYLPNDLKILSDRIYHEYLFTTDTQLTQQHITKAIAGFTPANLRGVNLEAKSGAINWQDIGGLTDAKRILIETLEWPTKYAPIFQNCPLRLRSGILLYGYPGCGKTLVASAIANECGVNFISIKGPEILNKYIGASEQSIRELFDRAQAAKPCILFFDEFDSIAPKRGHDSTGVTDRVVNQMLTQMDGAEGLDGVYVLAATSRPDLIDSALLRPGRLDKSVICDLPDYECRLDILERVCRKMDLAEDVDLTEIANRTEGFSGADLQGLVYNGYLKAVHVVLEQEKQQEEQEVPVDTNNVEFFKLDSKVNPHERVSLLHQIQQFTSKSETKVKSNGKSQVKITHDNFIESLRETKPSISISERNKLSNIYNQFINARDGNMPDGSASNEIGGRVTLM
ncbi:Peroxisome biosynthesis protein PAS1 [Spathaspora sp. JA1]|nr:Peroxisome biosynthesis protein PAS1 [Spathaspora sp. JA1]